MRQASKMRTLNKGSGSMGKALEARDAKPAKGLRGQFTRKFRELTEGQTPNDIAATLGTTPDMARKYLRGPYMPDIDQLPAVAAALGLKDWRDFFDPPKKK